VSCSVCTYFEGVELGWYLGPIVFSIVWEVIVIGWYWEFILLSFDVVESLPLREFILFGGTCGGIGSLEFILLCFQFSGGDCILGGNFVGMLIVLGPDHLDLFISFFFCGVPYCVFMECFVCFVLSCLAHLELTVMQVVVGVSNIW